MGYEIRRELVSSRPLAVVRRRASLPQLAKVVPDACGIVWNVVRAQQIAGAGRHVAIYWDDVINLEVGVELDAPFAGHGEVVRGDQADFHRDSLSSAARLNSGRPWLATGRSSSKRSRRGS